MCALYLGKFEDKREIAGSAIVGFNTMEYHLVQQCMGGGSRLFGGRIHLLSKWKKIVWVNCYHGNQMVLNIHTGGKKEDVSCDKAELGNDSRSTSFNWWDCWGGLVKVKFWGGKEGTGVNNSIH